MLILGVGILTGLTFLNMLFYEFRVLKMDDDKDLIKAWVNLRLQRRYK